MKVVILGARGYLGTALLSAFPDAATPQIDAADPCAVAAMLDTLRPDVLINAVGKTGRPNVDWCETHREETVAGNVTVPLVLLSACSVRSVYWVHLSSGCIYSGDNGGRGFAEDDPPNFAGSFYARTKQWAEAVLREFPMLILRPRMPFDGTTHERNLIMKLLRYPRVLDAENSLTAVPDFLAATKALVARRATGIYNIVNPGTASPWAIVERYRATVDPQHRCECLPLSAFRGVVAAGRSNCVLRTEKLERAGIRLRSVEDALDSALREIARVRAVVPVA